MARSKSKKKAEVGTEIPPPVPEGWDRCHAYIANKHRFCRQAPLAVSNDTTTGAKELAIKLGEGGERTAESENKPLKRPRVEGETEECDGKTDTPKVVSVPRYCGNHRHLFQQEISPESGSEIGFEKTDRSHKSLMKARRKRIPCPVDPSHTIFDDQVERHILVCPLTKRRQEEKNKHYYRENVNTGGHGSLGESSEDIASKSPSSVDWAVRVAKRILEVHSQLKINSIDRSEKEIESGLEEGLAFQRVKSGGAKHLPQLASLVGHLRHVVEGEQSNNGGGDVTLLELGAGRGMFGLVSAGMLNGSTTPINEGNLSRRVNLVMVERGGAAKSKADTILRGVNYGTMAQKKYKGSIQNKASFDNDEDVAKKSTKSNETKGAGEKTTSYLNLKGISWSRIVGDLAHVCLPTAARGKEKIAQGKENDNDGCIYVLAKHLCGAGTDLALKSMVSLVSSNDGPSRPAHKLRGCLLATCCHGVCNWNDYVGRDFLRNVMTNVEVFDGNPLDMFGASEFELMRRWSTGTVHDYSGPKRDRAASIDGTTKEKRNDDREVENDDAHKNTPYECDGIDDAATISVSTVVKALGDETFSNAQIIGRACQRLIDYGRKEYLHKVVFGGRSGGAAELCYYVPPDVTPQNALIIGISD